MGYDQRRALSWSAATAVLCATSLASASEVVLEAGAEDLEEALSTARSERVNETSAYLLGVPLLSDYLTDGLEKLGISIEE